MEHEHDPPVDYHAISRRQGERHLARGIFNSMLGDDYAPPMRPSFVYRLVVGCAWITLGLVLIGVLAAAGHR